MPQVDCPYCHCDFDASPNSRDCLIQCPKCDGEIELSPSGDAWGREYDNGFGVWKKSHQESIMVMQVRVVAILMIVQGGLESVAGLAVGVGIPVMAAALGVVRMKSFNFDFNMPQFVFYIVIGIVLLAIGISRITAGILNLRMRSREFGIATHVLGLLTAFTLYLAPTAIVVAIYGLIVYLNHNVTEAFRRNEAAVQVSRAIRR